MSSVRQRTVFDTSSLIPACLNPDREPAQILRRAVLWVDPLSQISECRDPKDNKFLELAVAAQADYWFQVMCIGLKCTLFAVLKSSSWPTSSHPFLKAKLHQGLLNRV